jgi:hypothetical protein
MDVVKLGMPQRIHSLLWESYSMRLNVIYPMTDQNRINAPVIAVMRHLVRLLPRVHSLPLRAVCRRWSAHPSPPVP